LQIVETEMHGLPFEFAGREIWQMKGVEAKTLRSRATSATEEKKTPNDWAGGAFPGASPRPEKHLLGIFADRVELLVLVSEDEEDSNQRARAGCRRTCKWARRYP
jgi:hypothetical protein